jgi:hypothetical protein
MSTPKGMKCTNRKLANGDRVLIYSNTQQEIQFSEEQAAPNTNGE